MINKNKIQGFRKYHNTAIIPTAYIILFNVNNLFIYLFNGTKTSWLCETF